MQAHKNNMLRSFVKSIQSTAELRPRHRAKHKHRQPVIHAAQAQATQAQATSYTVKVEIKYNWPIVRLAQLKPNYKRMLKTENETQK